MQQPTQHLLSGVAHHNQGLFSDYYLDNILPKEWAVLQTEAIEIMERLQLLYAKFTPNPNNEAQTEDDWIKPVLRELGHIYFEVQVPLDVPASTQKPDYIFYRNEAARIANKGKVVTASDLKTSAYAIGDAKKWERSLDKAAAQGSDAFNNKNPSYQIFFYMLHSGLPWGLLTNGRHWRLYHYETAHKLEVFYEVDLPALLETNDVKNFLYFYTFFRRGAFNEQGHLTLFQILTASTDYAQSVSDDLRQQVYDALRFVAQGFLDYPGNGLNATPETCKLIYDSSLTLLYRLLFIFYAEARDLLPLHSNSTYQRRYSLHAIKNDVATSLQEDLFPDSGIVWSRLKVLFHIIDLGRPPLNVTTFNGGLFDPKRHTFLEDYTVGDLSLCQAIDKLARVKSQFVDYRDLAERHLGTIYEGLLEYTLQVATEPMVELKSSSKIVPAEGVQKKDIAAEFQPGEVYLITDRGERKITGSYYTPDYIVKYMVEQVLSSILHDVVKDTESDEERIQAVLGINVLDPSMGSGHFPVEVVEYIARFLVELGVQPEELGEADMSYWKRRVAQQCIYGVDMNPLAVELAKLSLWLATTAKDRPLSFLDHHLRVGNALIGSWLSEVATDQHPRAKQSRKRAREVEEKAKEAGQLSLLSDDDFRQNTDVALEAISEIERSPSVTVKDVKAQETAYDELRRRFSDKYLRLADLGAAVYFDLEIDSNLWQPLADCASGKALIQLPKLDTIYQRVVELAQEKHFFHWELEFPDIFFDHQGRLLEDNAGFDVIIGNPPYVRQEQLGDYKLFFRDHYEVYHSIADLFIYFFAQGLRLLRKGGKLAYISSNMWLRTNYATPLRQYLRTRTTVETIIDLGNTRVFADAPDLTPTIQIVRKVEPTNDSVAMAAVFTRGEQIKAFREQLADRLFPISIYDQIDTGWQLASPALRTLFTKLMKVGSPLGEVVKGQIYRGLLTGLNEAFIINTTIRDHLVEKDPMCSTLIKPLVRGEDLRPWYQEDEGRWLICIPSGWTKRTFLDTSMTETQAWEKFYAHHPQLATYLYPFAEAARKRLDKGQYWWELRACEYYDAFENAKIFWPDIAKFPRFSWDEQGLVVNDIGFILLPADLSLLGILQSRVCWFCITRLCSPLAERVGAIIYRLKSQFITHLPIPSLVDEQRNYIGELVRQLTKVAQQRYQMRRKVTHRIRQDLGIPQAKLNQRLQTWWKLSFKEFREELVKVFKRDIPLKDRDDWEQLLQERSADIRRMTEEISRLEIELNKAVYAAFCLDDEEIELIEQEIKYQYGEW
jgi:type I restriction-modification system DNA methylase subunit